MLNQSRITFIWGVSNVPLFNWLSCNPVSLKTTLSFHSSHTPSFSSLPLLHSLSSNPSPLSFLAMKHIFLFFLIDVTHFQCLDHPLYFYFSSSLLSPPPVLSVLSGGAIECVIIWLRCVNLRLNSPSVLWASVWNCRRAHRPALIQCTYTDSQRSQTHSHHNMMTAVSAAY